MGIVIYIKPLYLFVNSGGDLK